MLGSGGRGNRGQVVSQGRAQPQWHLGAGGQIHSAHCLLPHWPSLTFWDFPKETLIHSFTCIHSFTHQTTLPFGHVHLRSPQCSGGDRALTRRNPRAGLCWRHPGAVGLRPKVGGRSMPIGDMGERGGWGGCASQGVLELSQGGTGVCQRRKR